MKIQFIFAWYDLWIGFYWDKKKRWLYILPLPMVGIILKFEEETNSIFKEWSNRVIQEPKTTLKNPLTQEEYEDFIISSRTKFVPTIQDGKITEVSVVESTIYDGMKAKFRALDEGHNISEKDFKAMNIGDFLGVDPARLGKEVKQTYISVICKFCEGKGHTIQQVDGYPLAIMCPHCNHGIKNMLVRDRDDTVNFQDTPSGRVVILGPPTNKDLLVFSSKPPNKPCPVCDQKGYTKFMGIKDDCSTCGGSGLVGKEGPDPYLQTR